MWDKLRIRERDRSLGLLFVIAFTIVCAESLLAVGSPLVGGMAGGITLGVFWLVKGRRIMALRQGNLGPAPVGPLSSDERAKARSKLLGARGVGVLAR